MSDETPTADRIDDELATHLATAFGFEDAPATFADVWERMLETFADALDRQVTLDDLCTTDESPHRAIVDGTTQHYRCVTDALILGTVVDRDVTVRTVSAVSDTELVVEFDQDGVRSVPDGAQLSFGVDRTVTPPDGPPTPEQLYGRLCPYSKAFATREEYEQWTEARPDVVSAASPLTDGLDTLSRLLSGIDAIGDETSQSAASTTASACACCTGGDAR